MSTFPQKNAQFAENFELEPGRAPGEASASQSPNLQSKVSVLTNTITDEAVRLVIGKVLTDLVFLLDYLSLVAGPRNAAGLRDVVLILNTVRSEAFSLAVFIENDALRLEGLDDRLRETLDSSAYAINHEVRRIYNGDLANLRLDRDDQETRGALQDAQGVLTNCFQGCMINVARVFDASLTDATLFQDWQSRRESSLVLSRDLSELIALVQRSWKESLEYFPQQSLNLLEERLASFRAGSMQCLMYKDWHQFESLLEAILATVRNGESPADLLHHMGCYLETLLAHVKSRAVLADLPLEATVYWEIDG